MMRQFLLLLWLLWASSLFGVASYTAGAQALKAMPAAYQPGLKNKSINAETLIANSAMVDSKRLSQQQIANLSLPAIDKSFVSYNHYYLIDTLCTEKDYYVLLLGQWYDFENKAWIASYAEPHRLLAFRQVFYDNAEGFLSVETTIQNNVISITTLNDFEEGSARKKLEKYRFAQNGQLQKMQ